LNDEIRAETASESIQEEGQTQEPLRKDLDAGLRFLHFMGMQTKQDIIDVTSRLFALIEELIASGQLDLRSFEERWLRLREKEEVRTRQRAHVQVSDPGDKYNLTDLPQVDCGSIMHICEGRCCKLPFPLSFQDLDERVVQWDYSTPYLIRKGPDGYCVHFDRDNGHCLVYENRPAPCRTYDCREDKRIWADFEKRILAVAEGDSGKEATGQD
jgi:Fe-S-cluster containining protein